MTAKKENLKSGLDAFDTLLKQIESGEFEIGNPESIWKCTDTSCRFENWKTYVIDFRNKLDSAKKKETMLATLEECWEDAI